MCIEDIKKTGYDTYFVDHTTGIYPVAASGTPNSAMAIASKGDVITDLHEDMAADGTVTKMLLVENMKPIDIQGLVPF